MQSEVYMNWTQKEKYANTKTAGILYFPQAMSLYFLLFSGDFTSRELHLQTTALTLPTSVLP